jgi:hypothetical protein
MAGFEARAWTRRLPERRASCRDTVLRRAELCEQPAVREDDFASRPHPPSNPGGCRPVLLFGEVQRDLVRY